MNWMLIETSPKLRAETLRVVEQRHALAAEADQCVRWLKAQGYNVIRVEQGAVGPRILIHASPLCKQLEGAVSAYLKGIEGARRYSFAWRHDCEVRWYEPQEGGAA